MLGHRGRRGQRPGRARRDDHGHAQRPARSRSTAEVSRVAHPGVGEAGSVTSPRTGTGTGLLLDAPLWENRILGHQTRAPQRAGRGSTAPALARTPSGSSTSTTSARPASTRTARALSGGNQQKLIVGREMSGDPVLLIAAHPTAGVDVGAQAAIWDHIKRRPPARPGRAADLRRPRRADRALRPDRGHPARPARRHASTPRRSPPRSSASAMTGEGRADRPAAPEGFAPARPADRGRDRDGRHEPASIIADRQRLRRRRLLVDPC